MEIIIVLYREKQALKKIFNTSYNTVRNALNGKTNTDRAKQIRKVAIERGAKVLIVKED